MDAIIKYTTSKKAISSGMAKVVRNLKMRVAVGVINTTGGFKSDRKVKQTFELNKRLINF
jgi:hypothetical protein